MSKAVLISIKPEWVKEILDGTKTVEIRKTLPKCESPFKVYIYCTKNGYELYPPVKLIDGLFYKALDPINGKVVAEWTAQDFYDRLNPFNKTAICENAGITEKQLLEYSNGGAKTIYGWIIDDLKIYDKPKELSEFGLTKAPQSWCYVEELEVE